MKKLLLVAIILIGFSSCDESYTDDCVWIQDCRVCLREVGDTNQYIEYIDYCID